MGELLPHLCGCYKSIELFTMFSFSLCPNDGLQFSEKPIHEHYQKDVTWKRAPSILVTTCKKENIGI